jgi:hypothetical protein
VSDLNDLLARARTNHALRVAILDDEAETGDLDIDAMHDVEDEAGEIVAALAQVPMTTRGSYDGMGPSNPVVDDIHYFGTMACQWVGSDGGWVWLPNP